MTTLLDTCKQSMDWIPLLQEVDKKTVILTPNRRLTVALHELYRAHQITQQEKSWETPSILPVERWLETVYLASISELVNIDHPTLLNDAQANYLWKDIISRHEALQSLIQVKETAKLMQSAWVLLIAWQLTLSTADCRDYPDYLLLLSCIEEYETLCNRQHWLDKTQLPTYLVNLIVQHPDFKQQLPHRILLSGFNELTPALNAFFEALIHHGCDVIVITLKKLTSQPCVVAAETSAHEYNLMAHWAKATLDKHQDAHIACIVPNLPEVRDQIKKTFEEVFFAENQFCYDTNAMPFNLSAGKRLSEYSIIKIALHLLSLHETFIYYDDLSPILHSSFVGDSVKESKAREQYALLLKKSNVHHVSLEQQEDARYALKQYCPLLFNRFQAALKAVRQQASEQTIDLWITLFNEILTLFGWPGEPSLDSHLFQITDAWLQLCYKITTIQMVAGSLTYQEALSLLSDVAADTVFQTKTPRAPIQILGALEATGIPFDYIWLSGLDDLTWPPKPKPHPFIPKVLQLAHQMPHASSLREYQYCKRLMQQFSESSEQLICSYAKSNDHLERYMSPLLYDIDIATIDSLNIPSTENNIDKIARSKQVEYFHDNKGPELDLTSPVKGGAYTIKAQSHCPFKGFAEGRLFSKHHPLPVATLHVFEKGILLHQAMSLIWNHIKNHDALLALDNSRLTKLILNSIKKSIALIMQGKIKSSAFLKIEKKRLFYLIKKWMLLERERPYFTVSHIEEKMVVTIAGAEFSFRVDRIDQLENNDKMIIDYKSGKSHKAQHWLGERPDDPQLIMYLLGQENDATSIAFARICASDMGFAGASRDDINVSGVRPIQVIQANTTWDDSLRAWKETVSKLCQEFIAGDAEVRPTHLETTCGHCQQQSFCRIKEIIDDPSNAA